MHTAYEDGVPVAALLHVLNGCLAEAEFFREDGTRFQFKELPVDSWRVEVFPEDDG